MYYITPTYHARYDFYKEIKQNTSHVGGKNEPKRTFFKVVPTD